MARKSRDTTITFKDDELQAVLIGLVLLERRDGTDEDEDGEPAGPAALALRRIEAALQDSHPGPAPKPRKGDARHQAAIREAIHFGRKLRLRYVDKKGAESHRTIWPLEIGSFGVGDSVAAWCEARRDFRHFRLDSIAALERSEERYPSPRRILLARLHASELEQGF